MEDVNYARFFFAFLFTLGLIGLCAMLLKRFGGRLMLPMPTRAGRIRVVEAQLLGPRHRLVLVQRDGVEHLILIGPENVCVVEQGIKNEK